MMLVSIDAERLAHEPCETESVGKLFQLTRGPLGPLLLVGQPRVAERRSSIDWTLAGRVTAAFGAGGCVAASWHVSCCPT